MRMALANTLSLLMLVGCNAQSAAKSTATPLAAATGFGILHEGLGTACASGGLVGPVSYRVLDLGKADVPTLDRSSLRMLKRIEQYVPVFALRFSYLKSTLIIYNAARGPCYSGVYSVLNAAGCNVIYSPSDATGRMFEGPGGCLAKPRPWIPHDRGNPNGPASW